MALEGKGRESSSVFPQPFVFPLGRLWPMVRRQDDRHCRRRQGQGGRRSCSPSAGREFFLSPCAMPSRQSSKFLLAGRGAGSTLWPINAKPGDPGPTWPDGNAGGRARPWGISTGSFPVPAYFPLPLDSGPKNPRWGGQRDFLFWGSPSPSSFQVVKFCMEAGLVPPFSICAWVARPARKPFKAIPSISE